MLYTEVTQTVRSLCQDLLQPTRYSDDDIAIAVNNGLALAFRLRPDLYVGSFEVPHVSSEDLQATTFAVPIDDMYAPALAEHAAGWLMLRDDEYTADGRASGLLATYRSALIGTGAAG
jgi:hypothetical protein